MSTTTEDQPMSDEELDAIRDGRFMSDEELEEVAMIAQLSTIARARLKPETLAKVEAAEHLEAIDAAYRTPTTLEDRNRAIYRMLATGATKAEVASILIDYRDQPIGQRTWADIEETSGQVVFEALENDASVSELRKLAGVDTALDHF